MDTIFQQLVNIIHDQQVKIATIAEKLSQIESIGGGGSGNATIADYQSAKKYVRNTLVVDPTTETVYRVLHEYTSDTVANDLANGDLKLIGYESQVMTYSAPPTQSQIENLPDDTLVAVYNANDTPYDPNS